MLSRKILFSLLTFSLTFIFGHSSSVFSQSRCPDAMAVSAVGGLDFHLPRPEQQLVLQPTYPNNLYLRAGDGSLSIFFTAQAALHEYEVPLGLTNDRVLVRDSTHRLYVLSREGELLDSYDLKARGQGTKLHYDILRYQAFADGREALLIEITEFKPNEGQRTRFELLHISSDGSGSQISAVAKFGATTRKAFLKPSWGAEDPWSTIGSGRGGVVAFDEDDWPSVVAVVFSKHVMVIDLATGQLSKRVEIPFVGRIDYAGLDRPDLRVSVAPEEYIGTSSNRWDRSVRVSRSGGELRLSVRPGESRPSFFTGLGR